MAKLDQYTTEYGPRLQSLLQSTLAAIPQPTTPSMDAGAGPSQSMMQSQPAPAGAPVSALAAPALAAPMSPGPREQMGPPQPSATPGRSFKDLWDETPKPEKRKFADDLETSLKRGNQTIDKAYDEMIQQLGTRPSGKLSREDKGMLLMEFGLSLMANSARGRQGNDLGGAIGASGLQTLGSYQKMTKGRQAGYDAQVSEIQGERSKAKSRLAETGATEGIRSSRMLEEDRMKQEADAARLAEENQRLQGTIQSETGEVFGYTRKGRTSALLDEKGEQIKGKRTAQNGEPLVAVLDENGVEIYVPRSQAAGMRKRQPTGGGGGSSDKGGLKASDTNAIYKQAAGLFGGTFDPITGRIAGLSREQSETVQQIASRASQLYVEGGLPHATAVEQAFQEARGERTAPTGVGAAGSALDAPREFRDETEVGRALDRGTIEKGDVVTVNGKRFKVQ